MENEQIILLKALARELKDKPKTKEESFSFLKSANILDSKGNYSKHYPTLRSLYPIKK